MYSFKIHSNEFLIQSTFWCFDAENMLKLLWSFGIAKFVTKLITALMVSLSI